MPGPRWARKRPTGVSSPRRCEQLDPAAADEHGRRLDALLGDDLAVLEGGAEQARVRLDGLVEVGERRRRRDGCPWSPRRRCYCPSSGTGRRQDGVDEAVLDRLGRRHEPIAVDVLHHGLDVAAGVAADDLGHLPRRRGDLAGRDLDVGRSAAEAGAPLVDHQLRVREREPLARGAARHDHRRGRHAHPEADRRDVGPHVLHRVVDRHARVRRAAGRVDVERDVAFGIVGLEQQELRDDQVRDLVVDLAAEEDDPVAEQPGVDVERALRRGRRIRSLSGSLALHVLLTLMCNCSVAQ